MAHLPGGHGSTKQFFNVSHCEAATVWSYFCMKYSIYENEAHEYIVWINKVWKQFNLPSWKSNMTMPIIGPADSWQSIVGLFTCVKCLEIIFLDCTDRWRSTDKCCINPVSTSFVCNFGCLERKLLILHPCYHYFISSVSLLVDYQLSNFLYLWCSHYYHIHIL